jgi:polysaccharide deacetylase family protein (PEP-CTERM system associated)
MPAVVDVNERLFNAMTVDVEEYFQVSAFAGIVGANDWESLQSRVEGSIDRLLELFSAHDARCTFFTLGWVAERHKSMIRRIVDAGHEMASHGYCHQRATDQTPEQFRDDVRRTKAILEDISGTAITGYRAASFSFAESNPWTHGILSDEGYEYSSSVYPVRHDHYGIPTAPRRPYRPLGDSRLVEYPLSTVRLFGRNLPCSGGGYFRLIPYSLSRWALQRVNRSEKCPAVFYFHPWEIDPDQPRMAGLGRKTRFRHYVNLTSMEQKLARLLADFAWDRMDRVIRSTAGTAS